MKIKIKKLFLPILASILCVLCVACNRSARSVDDTANRSVIHGKTFHFANDRQRQEWEEPLAKLLSNVLVPYGEHGEIMGTQAAIDPNAPSIPASYTCGLLDITGDGVPELLVHPLGYGGSAGNATYFIYDIYSGQELGSIDGGHEGAWCVYYDTEAEGLQLIGQYWWRYGWPERDRFIKKVKYDPELQQYTEDAYFRTYHVIDAVWEEAADADPNQSVGWVESYPSTTFYLHGQEVSMDDYYTEYDRFVKTCIRIPETELVLFYWDDVSDDEDSYEEKGRKMAHALISSEQEFIQP